MTETDRDDPIKPTQDTERPNLSTEHQRGGDARRPHELLDKDQVDQEPDGPKRKTSLTRNE